MFWVNKLSLKTIQLQYGRVYKQRKCGVDFRLLCRRFWQNPSKNKRYNAPHLDSMGIDTQNAYSHIAIQEMSAVRTSFCFVETVRFPTKDSENTFNMSVIRWLHYKIKNIFRNEQHSVEHCSVIIKNIRSQSCGYSFYSIGVGFSSLPPIFCLCIGILVCRFARCRREGCLWCRCR